MQKIRKAIIPAGGLGTRFLPATKAMPKEMLPIVGKPLIQYAVEEAHAAGIEQIILVTGKGKSAIEDHFDRSITLEMFLKQRRNHSALEILQQINDLPPIAYVRQQEPLGLGDAILCASDWLGDEPFAVILPDDLIIAAQPCLQQLCAVYERTGGGTILALRDVPHSEVYRYGIVTTEARDDLTLVTSIIEKPSVGQISSNTAVIGRYIFEQKINTYLRDSKAHMQSLHNSDTKTNNHSKANSDSKAHAEKRAAGQMNAEKRIDAQMHVGKLVDDRIHSGKATSEQTSMEKQTDELFVTPAISTAIEKQRVYGVHFTGEQFDCGNRLGFLKATVFCSLHDQEIREEMRYMLAKYN